MSNYIPYAIVAGVGIVLAATATYALSGSSSNTSLRPASDFPLTDNTSSSSGYINPVSPSQTPPRDMPYPKNLATSLVTNVGGKRRTKRKQSRKKRIHTKRRK